MKRTKLVAYLAPVYQGNLGNIHLTWPEFCASLQKALKSWELNLGAEDATR